MQKLSPPVLVLTISMLTVLVLIVAQGVVFSQVRPGQPLSRDQAIRARNSDLERIKRERELQRQQQQMQQMADENQRLREKKETVPRPSRARKSDAGFPTPQELNDAIAKLSPGQMIDLHGDLFTTVDGVLLAASYYKGGNEKESIPVLLLHGKNGSRNDFRDLIPQLTKQGMAVLVPDLRGHGKSTEQIVEEFGRPAFAQVDSVDPYPFSRRGNAGLQRRWSMLENASHETAARPDTKVADYLVRNFRDIDYDAMSSYDLRLLQEFLVHENNEGRLNLNKLIIIGVDMGAGVGAVWAKNDWVPPRGEKALKMCKSLVMVSPPPADQLKPDFFSPKALRDGVAFMLIVGEDLPEAVKGAEAIKEVIVDKKTDNAPGVQAKCPLILCKTEKQGAALLGLSTAKLGEGIPYFIEQRLKDAKEGLVKWEKMK